MTQSTKSPAGGASAAEAPVTDDRPYRLSPDQPRAGTADVPQWRRDAELNFLGSAFVRRSLPPEIVANVHDAFARQQEFDRHLLSGRAP